jgi:hypothetical protein
VQVGSATDDSALEQSATSRTGSDRYPHEMKLAFTTAYPVYVHHVLDRICFAGRQLGWHREQTSRPRRITGDGRRFFIVKTKRGQSFAGRLPHTKKYSHMEGYHIQEGQEVYIC